MVYRFFDKETSGSGIKNDKPDHQLGEELYKPIIRNFNKRKVHSTFIDKIWDANLTDMQLISKFNKRILFLLCAIDIFSKYAIINAFQKILKKYNRKPNKILIDRGSKFYNRSMKS